MKNFFLTSLVIVLVCLALFSSCERVSKKFLVVASTGGDFTRLSDALKSITDATATNRYTVIVKGTIVEDGNQPEVDGYIDAKSHVDVIGQGATIEVWGSAVNQIDYALQFLDVIDSEWRDLNIVAKELWNKNDLEYVGDNSSNPFVDIGFGCSFPVKIRGKTDRTCRLVDIKSSWDWQAGTKGWTYGGAIFDLASPTLINCEFRGGEFGSSIGLIIYSIGSPLLTNCSFVGGGGTGIELGANNYGLIIDGGSPTLIGCLAEGGLGSIYCHAIYINGGEPTLINCVGKPQEFSYTFTYNTDNVSANGVFRPEIGADYRYLTRDLRLAFPAQMNDWTVNIGVSPGGTELASISGSGNMTYPYSASMPMNGYVCDAGSYLYISTSNITGNVYLKYTVMPAIGEIGAITAGLYINNNSHARIINSIFFGTWLWNPPLAFETDDIREGPLKSLPQWEITGSSFIQLWKTGITLKACSALNWFGPFFEMPAYYCTFNADFYNVGLASAPAYNETGQ